MRGFGTRVWISSVSKGKWPRACEALCFLPFASGAVLLAVLVLVLVLAKGVPHIRG